MPLVIKFHKVKKLGEEGTDEEGGEEDDGERSRKHHVAVRVANLDSLRWTGEGNDVWVRND